MLNNKAKSFFIVLFCVALMTGAATQVRAQDAQDNSASTDTKPQIPAALIQKWQQEADQGNADAQYLLGNAYFTGNGVPQDYSEAASLWHKSAAQGNTEAQRALDQMVPK